MQSPVMIGPVLDLRHGRMKPPLPRHSLVVQKYGGTLLRSPAGRASVVEQISRTRASGRAVVVVASAMGRAGEPYATDTLLRLATDIGPDIDARTQDLLLSCGEVISTALLAHLLTCEGYPAVALTGREAGIVTNDHFGQADIMFIQPLRVLRALKDHQIPVVAGFQGRTATGDITTLGRGGSDVSAVALAAAMGADVEIFKDVDGMLTADPRLVPAARHIPRMSYDVAAQAGWLGAQVLHPRAAEIARAHAVPLTVRPVLGGPGSGTEFFCEASRRTTSESSKTCMVVHTPDVPLAPESTVHCARVSLVGSGLGDLSDSVRQAESVLRAAGVQWLGVETHPSGSAISWLVWPESLQTAARALHRAFVEDRALAYASTSGALVNTASRRQVPVSAAGRWR